MAKQVNHIVVIGSLGAPFGIKGWLKINSYTQPKENIFNYQDWLLKFSDNWQAIEVEDRLIKHNLLAIKLHGCSTPQQAKLYTHAQLGVYRESLPQLAKDEYYWDDLVGLTVINQDGVILGQIEYLFETGSNDVMVVRDDKEYLIPYLPGIFVLAVKLDKKQVVVNWDPDF